jgi:predicted permease
MRSLAAVRYAFRSLRQAPASSVAIVATLALCMGANTAVFSVVDAMLFRPLPYPDPNRLARVVYMIRAHGAEGMNSSVTGRDWEMIRDHAMRLEPAVYSDISSGANLAAAGRVEYVEQQRVSAGFFRVLGVPPMLGREFTREEDRAGGPRAMVVSYGLWKRVFGGDPAVSGRAVTLRGEPYTVVGVMPESFQSSVTADLWTPLQPSTEGEGGGDNYAVCARLRPGSAWAEANAEIESLGKALQEGRKLPQGIESRMQLITLQEGFAEGWTKPLWLLWSAVGLVLLIGCVNIAGLLLARAQSRRREIATRMALGGARLAIVRQLVLESLMLSVAGGALGVVTGWAALAGVKSLAAGMLPSAAAITIDLRVLAVTGAVALITALLFGIYPALEASGVDIRSAMAEGSRSVAGTSRRLPRRILVAGEVALALVLLAGAALLVRTLIYLQNRPAGFDGRNVISATFSLQDARYTNVVKTHALFRDGLDRIRRIPGVEAAAVGLHMPYERALNLPFQLPGNPETLITSAMYVTPDYFAALRIPVRDGRIFSDTDLPSSRPVAVVNEAFIRHYLKGAQAVGSHLKLMGGEAREIVGVVSDVRQRPGWGDSFAPIDAVPNVYVPDTQFGDSALLMVHTWFSPSWIVRAQGDDATLRSLIHQAVSEADPMLPIASFRTVSSIRAKSLQFQSLITTLLGVLAGLAVLLAVLGVYGLTANAVAERTRELGIRMALGADRITAINTAALPTIRLASVGAVAGLVGALGAARLLASFVWGMRPTDPATLAASAAALVAVAAGASIVPALRILRLNAADVLRQE